MRCLAWARYRYLLAIRSTGIRGGFIATLILLALFFLPLLFGWSELDREFPNSVTLLSPLTAMFAGLAVVIHSVLLAIVTCTLGVSPQAADRSASSDLVESAPVGRASLYWGDVLGIFAAMGTLHLCLVPMIAVLFAMSPFATTTFWAAETATMLIVFFVSSFAAWALRAVNWRWSLARIARGGTSIVLIVLVVAGILSRRPLLLSEAFVWFMENPGTAAWRQVEASFRSPAGAVATFAALYLTFIAFFSLHSVRRPIES